MSWLSSALGGITKTVKGVGPLAALIPGAGPWIAGLGALSTMDANQRAERDARNAGKEGKALEARSTAIWDMLLKNVQEADKAGQFDPERRIAALEKDTANYEGKDLGNLAGALRVSGYRVGDSEIGTRLDSVKLKYQKYLDTMREKIRTDTFNQKQSAYALPSQYLQPGIQGSQFRQVNAQNSVSDPSGFAASLMALLNKKPIPPSTDPAFLPTLPQASIPSAYPKPTGFKLGPTNYNFKKAAA